MLYEVITVLLRLSSSEKDIIDSYSEQNYVLTPLTQSDIDLMLAEEPSQSTDMDSDDMDDFNFEGDQAIRITEEVLEEHLSSNYKTYMLTVKWIAPESYENRGFDWNAKSKTSIRITSYNVCYTKLLRLNGMRIKPSFHFARSFGQGNLCYLQPCRQSRNNFV